MLPSKKNIRKTLISTVFLSALNGLLSMKTDGNIPTARNKQKNKEQQLFFCKPLKKSGGSRTTEPDQGP
jgi:hypothetical protein